MSYKGKAKLRLLAFLHGTDMLTDAEGENEQQITVPMTLTGNDGLNVDTELDIDIRLSPEEIADLVLQRNSGRYAVMILELED